MLIALLLFCDFSKFPWESSVKSKVPFVDYDEFDSYFFTHIWTCVLSYYSSCNILSKTDSVKL